MLVITFSIIITIFNHLSLLKKAIDSALNQTTPCEVIVLDDYSGDGTATHRNWEIKLYITVTRKIWVMLFLSILESKSRGGKWIKLLDDDDYLALNCKQVPFGTPVQIAFRRDAIRFGL